VRALWRAEEMDIAPFFSQNSQVSPHFFLGVNLKIFYFCDVGGFSKKKF
jgi:hypothetical protein